MSLIKPLLLIITLIPAWASALPSDREKPIEIESNSADIDNKKGISIYRGDVVMTQGSTRLMGDTITIRNNKNREVTKVIAEGKRAYYEEQQEGEAGVLKAWGETIHYDMAGDHIELIKQAQLTQKGDTFKGEKIDYNLKLQTVSAQGKPVKNGSEGRVKMVIQPRNEQPQKATGG